MKQRLSAFRDRWLIPRSPDRRVLTQLIFPNLLKLEALRAGESVLWLGCRSYTKNYYRILESRGASCHTLDIDPSLAQWGQPGRHTVGNALALSSLYPQTRFSAVLCNGLFGWGIDSVEYQTRCAREMAHITKPGAWLLLGWNTDRCADPRAAGVLGPFFSPESPGMLPDRQMIPGTTHVYDFYRRAPAPLV